MDLFAELRRLRSRKPATLAAALATLDEVDALRRELTSRRDETGAELTRVRLNLHATRAYAGVSRKGRAQ